LSDSQNILGLIAGNGRFPFLLLDAARAQGLSLVVAAIKEETDPEIDTRAAADPAIRVHWLSLGELSRLIDTFKTAGVTRAVMAGQVKHTQIFSSIRPDWRLAKLLLNLGTRSTDKLLGAVAKILADEGIELISSTQYLEPLLAKPGVLTQRAPSEDERTDIAYGLSVARGLAAFDLGQTVVIASQACVAVEAMEGTDATIERAGAHPQPCTHRRQGRQARAGHALRRPRYRPCNHRNHGSRRRYLPRRRGWSNTALRCRRHLHGSKPGRHRRRCRTRGDVSLTHV
jgi:hypothetical protein